MIKSFPEIELFFKQDSFTQEQLEVFKDMLKIYYTEPDLFEKAQELVNLKLLYFELSNKKRPRINNIKLRQFRIEESSKNLETSENESNLNKVLKEFVNKTPSSIANSLKIRPSMLVTMLEQKGIIVTETTPLDIHSVSVLNAYIKNRIKWMGRSKEKENAIKKPLPKAVKRKSSKKPIKAYDKLLTYGMSKLIYIRKK